MQVDGVSVSADGRLYLARRADAFVIGQLDSLAQLRRFVREDPSSQVLMHPDSQRVLVDSPGGTVEVVEIRTGRVLRRFDSAQRLIALDPDGTRVFCNDSEGLVVRDVDTGRPLLARVPWINEMREISRVDVFGDDWLLVAGEPGSFVTHLVAVQVRSGDAKLLQKFCSVLQVWPLPDKRRAVVVENQGRVRLWDVASGEQVRTLKAADSEERPLRPEASVWIGMSDLDETGRRFLSLSLDWTVREVTVADGRATREFRVGQGHDGKNLAWIDAHAVFLDANRRAVVTLSAADEVQAWSVESGGVLHAWRLPGARRVFRLGTRWFAATSNSLVLLERDRPRVLWEGASAPSAIAAARGNGLLLGTEEGSVHFALP